MGGRIKGQVKRVCSPFPPLRANAVIEGQTSVFGWHSSVNGGGDGESAGLGETVATKWNKEAVEEGARE